MKVRVTITATTWYSNYITVPDNATDKEIDEYIDEHLYDGDYGNIIDETIEDVRFERLD